MEMLFQGNEYMDVERNRGLYSITRIGNDTNYYFGIKSTSFQKQHGKYYYEITFDKIIRYIIVGVCKEEQEVKNLSAYSYMRYLLGVDTYGENIYFGSYNSDFCEKTQESETIGICLDYDKNEIGVITNNGTYKKIPDENRFSREQKWCLCILFSNKGEKCTVNLGNAPFKHKIPDGYIPYETVNCVCLINKNSKLYTTKTEFYDVENQKIKPLPVTPSNVTKEDIKKYGFDIRTLNKLQEDIIVQGKKDNQYTYFEEMDKYLSSTNIKSVVSKIVKTNKKDLTDGLSKNNISASSYHSGRYEYFPFLAFDNHKDSNSYCGFQMNDVKDGESWLKVAFEKPVSPSIIVIQGNEDYKLPNKIKIYMSNDDVHYDYIGELTGVWKRDCEKHEYTLEHPKKAYKYLKMVFWETKDGWIEINQIEVFEDKKYILLKDKKSNDIYTCKGDNYQLVKTTCKELVKQDFLKNGFLDFDALNHIKDIGKYNICVYSENNNDIELKLELNTKRMFFDVLELKDNKFELIVCTNTSNSEFPSNLKLKVKCKKTPFLHDKKILIYNDDNKSGFQCRIDGERPILYKTKVALNGNEVLKEENTWQSSDKNYKVKLEEKNLMYGDNIVDITLKQDNGIDVNKRIVVNNNTQRNYSLKFDGSTYVSCPVPQEFKLDDKKVQVIVKPDGGDWGIREDSGTFVTIKNCNVTIGYKQKCIIDEVRIWEKEKAQEYADVPLKGDEEGLVALYRFNEFEGDKVFDSGLNCYHGEIIGNVQFVNERKLEQNVVNAVITNDIGDEEVKILPKNSVYDYNVDVIRPQTPTTNIFEKRSKDAFEKGVLSSFKINKKNWERINGVNILEDENRLQITGVKKSKYNTQTKIDELGLITSEFTVVGEDVKNKNVKVNTSEFKQAVTSYNNSITVYQEDGSKVTANNKFLLYNIEPKVILGMVKDMQLFLQMGDEEGERIQFRIEINGKQVYPSEGYTPLEQTPVNFTKQLESKGIKIGEQNLLKVYVKDEYEAEITHTLNFVGEYCGLMFLDEEEKYYSTDLGDIINRLDFGVITAGRRSDVKRVYLKNTTGFEIQDLTISINKESVPKNNTVKLSTQPTPFDAVDKIHFAKNLKNGEKIPFYVQVATKVMDSEDGTFTIVASADPV